MPGHQRPRRPPAPLAGCHAPSTTEKVCAVGPWHTWVCIHTHVAAHSGIAHGPAWHVQCTWQHDTAGGTVHKMCADAYNTGGL